MPVISSSGFYQPPTPENISKFENSYAVVLTKDGKEYGGSTYTFRKLDEATIRLYQAEYYGGRWHHIPIIEIEDIKVA